MGKTVYLLIEAEIDPELGYNTAQDYHDVVWEQMRGVAMDNHATLKILELKDMAFLTLQMELEQKR